METSKQKIYRMLRVVSPKQNKNGRGGQQLKNKDRILVSRRLNSQNNSHKYIFNHTTVGTPFDKSTMLSYLSTPNDKSTNPHFITFVNNSKKYKYKYKQQRAVESTEEENLSWNKIKINFILAKKSISKLFDINSNMTTVRQVFVNDILTDKIKNTYYGIIGFSVIPYQYQLERNLKDKKLKLEYLSQRNIKQITLSPILLKNKLGYQDMQFKDFEIMKYLGSGGFSSVYLGKCLLDGQYCALKFINKNTITSPKKINMLQNQKNILFTINHQNVIDLLYAFQTQHYIVFGLEYCPYGNLYHFLQKHKQLKQPLAKSIIKQILNGLQYLHQNNILFRDVKLQNILFDAEGKIKITDFGLSKPDVEQDQITFSYCGSPQYMAPQMLAKSGHSYQVDYYALGILTYQLLYGKSPFYAPKKEDIFAAIINSDPYFPKQPSISKQAKSLIKGLLEKNPKHRIGSLKGIKQINSHPWLRQQISWKQMIGEQRELLHEGWNKGISSKQLKNIKELFDSEKNCTKPQKYFFQQSFVNMNLLQRIEKNCLIFRKNVMRQNSKKKPNKIL